MDKPPQSTRPEIIIGLVGPIGTPLASVENALRQSLETVGYEMKTVDLMSLVGGLAKNLGLDKPIPTTVEERYHAKMTLGDQLRERTAHGDVLALLGLAQMQQIRKERRATTETRPVAYVLSQLKTKYEIATLRQTYGDNCVILAAYAPKSARVESLARRIAKSLREQTSDEHHAAALDLIARDQSEPTKMGQNVQDAFPLADVFINAGSADLCKAHVLRFIEVFFQHPVRTPRRDEFGMFQAYGSGLRSADWGRQVGAAICTPAGDLIALGVNEVPRAHGGQYWEEDDDSLDNRDWKRPLDSNAQIIRSILADLLKRMEHHGCLTDVLRGKDLADDVELAKVEALVTGPLPAGGEKELPRSLRERAQLRNLIEYFRSVHAEMSALTSAALRGISVKGCTLYVTTFPCHECAKHIVAAGINRVVFIEPYPKSRVPDLYDDSIRVDGKGDETHIGCEAFMGVAPRRYTDWFLMPDRKKDEGWIEWESARIDSKPRNAREAIAYEHTEQDKIADLAKILAAHQPEGADLDEDEEEEGRLASRRDPEKRKGRTSTTQGQSAPDRR